MFIYYSQNESNITYSLEGCVNVCNKVLKGELKAQPVYEEPK